MSRTKAPRAVGVRSSVGVGSREVGCGGRWGITTGSSPVSVEETQDCSTVCTLLHP